MSQAKDCLSGFPPVYATEGRPPNRASIRCSKYSTTHPKRRVVTCARAASISTFVQTIRPGVRGGFAHSVLHRKIGLLRPGMRWLGSCLSYIAWQDGKWAFGLE